eukprot:scaffold212_cov384-Pavlova_lutheri.AAC.2
MSLHNLSKPTKSKTRLSETKQTLLVFREREFYNECLQDLVNGARIHYTKFSGSSQLSSFASPLITFHILASIVSTAFMTCTFYESLRGKGIYASGLNLAI